MIKYRPFECYAVAIYLHPLLEMKDGGERDTLIRNLTFARCALTTFIGPLIDEVLPSSKKKAEGILEMIDHVVFSRPCEVPGVPGLESIQVAIKKFETILDDELSKAPIFCLERIGNLSIDSLLSGASAGYDKDVSNMLADACKQEIDESGKCLAYERATASGFHILRAVEITIKQYLSLLPEFTMPPLNRQNWGEYIKLLGDNGASREVTDTLHNIKVNYRNPLMHPEDVLNLKEAISLFSVSQAMIETLIADAKHRRLML